MHRLPLAAHPALLLPNSHSSSLCAETGAGAGAGPSLELGVLQRLAAQYRSTGALHFSWVDATRHKAFLSALGASGPGQASRGRSRCLPLPRSPSSMCCLLQKPCGPSLEAAGG